MHSNNMKAGNILNSSRTSSAMLFNALGVKFELEFIIFDIFANAKPLNTEITLKRELEPV